MEKNKWLTLVNHPAVRLLGGRLLAGALAGAVGALATLGVLSAEHAEVLQKLFGLC